MLSRLAIPVLVLLAAPGAAVSAQEPGQPAETAAQPLEMFAIIYSPGEAWQAGRPMSEQGLRPHGAYIAAQTREGTIRAAGPLGADGGLVLLNVATEAEAQAFVAADPAVSSGIFRAEIDLWVPRFRIEQPFAR